MWRNGTGLLFRQMGCCPMGGPTGRIVKSGMSFFGVPTLQPKERVKRKAVKAAEARAVMAVEVKTDKRAKRKAAREWKAKSAKAAKRNVG